MFDPRIVPVNESEFTKTTLPKIDRQSAKYADRFIFTATPSKTNLTSNWQEGTQYWMSEPFHYTFSDIPQEYLDGNYHVSISIWGEIEGQLDSTYQATLDDTLQSPDLRLFGLGCQTVWITVWQSFGDERWVGEAVISDGGREVCAYDPSSDFLFYDVPHTPEKYIFYDQVQNLVDDGIVNGYEDGYFRPGHLVTRKEMSKFIKRAFTIPTDTSCGDFSDVDTSNVFYEDIMSLKCTGIVSGRGYGSYSPEHIVTRGEAAKFVMNALREMKGDSTYLLYTEEEQLFTDVPTDYTFYEHIMAAQGAGIVSGYEDGSFDPDNWTTRGAMSKFVDIGRNK
jgi:hypothetical protein